MQHALWLDEHPRAVMTTDYLSRFKSMGFRTGAVMLDTVGRGFDPKWSLLEVARLGEMFRANDIELVLTIWPEPRREFIDDLRLKLPAYLKASGTAALEQDAEGNFIKSKLRGYSSLKEASDAIAVIMKDFARTHDVRNEVTTFTMHAENSEDAVLSDDADRILAQGYSVRNRSMNGKPFLVPWDHQCGPGRMQRTTFDRSKRIPQRNGKPSIACGLAAYDQEWPGHKGEEAMQVAYEAALAYEPKEVRWWSSKWVIGHLARPYAQRFFESLASKT